MGSEGDISSGLRRDSARALALAAGFSEAGLVALPHANDARDSKRFREWIREGRAGTMHYLNRTGEDGRLARERVATPFPWARSALVCFARYGGNASLSTEAHHAASGWIARYAWSSKMNEKGERRPSDYHKVLLKRIRGIDAQLHEQFGAFESRAYVDTGPVVERSLAVAAGLGWTGKNTCLIHPKLGSFGFLAVLLMSLEAGGSAGEQASEPAESMSAVQRGNRGESTFEIPDHCGTCTRCIDACPTHALDVPYRMDATRCIAYLTIEHKGPIDEALMPGIGRQVFGCDICQDVCPWNGKARRAERAEFDAELEPRQELVNPALDWLGSLDQQSFEKQFNGSPVRRAGFDGLRRNIAVSMGNSGQLRFVPKLEEWTRAADVGLRTAARWALQKLQRG